MIRLHKTTYFYPLLAMYMMLSALVVFYTSTITKHHKPAVIFDLDGVLFRTSKSVAFKKLGGGSVLAYALSGGSPQNLQKMAFDILFKLRNEDPASFDTQVWPTYNGAPLPTIMYEWQQGTKHYQTILDEVLPFVDQLDEQGYFKNNREKELIQNIFNLMFDPSVRIDATKPLKEGINLLKHYKDNGYQVYVLSNMDTPSMDLLLEKYNDIFSLCDGIVYSGDIKQIKPYDGIYTYLLSKYELDPANCTFFDNQQENVDAAIRNGIPSMLCTPQSMKALHKQLQSEAIIQKA